MELIASFLVGFAFRAIVVEVFKFLIKLKKTPQLPAVLVVGAVIYYYMLDDLYSDLEFINYVVISGMFFPELYKIAIQIATLFEKKKQKPKKTKLEVPVSKKKIHKINGSKVVWSSK